MCGDTAKATTRNSLVPDANGDGNGPTTWRCRSRWWWLWSYHVTVMVKMETTIVLPPDGDGQDGENNDPTITMWRWWSRRWSELWSRQWSYHDDSDHTYATRIMLLLMTQIMMTMLFGWCRQWWKLWWWKHDQSAIRCSGDDHSSFAHFCWLTCFILFHGES